jgi:nicotinamidase-related amidase
MKKGLLLIDIQNDYFAGGNIELVGMDQAAHNAGLLLQAFRGANPLFFIFTISQNVPGQRSSCQIQKGRKFTHPPLHRQAKSS